MAYLHPGQVVAFAEPAQVTTILGSCVAVCLYNPHRGIGGMNHFVLPGSGAHEDHSARFAEPAFDQLLSVLRLLGAPPPSLYAKLFGGAGNMGAGASEPPVGQRNVDAARELLRRHAIPLVAEDVGGPCGRKLLFETAGGAAWVRRLGGGR
jgi:chemotaxis protein CheD